MSEATAAIAEAASGTAKLGELRCSAYLMSPAPGLYSLFHPGQRGTSLPGVRVNVSPGATEASGVRIAGFSPDGWVGPGEALLIRIERPETAVLVTIYHAPNAEAPRLQVVRIADANGRAVAVPGVAEAGLAQPIAEAARGSAAPARGVLAHIQRRGDVAAAYGDWLGEPGSGLWIEGFSLTAPEGFDAEELSYQAVLGRGWLSPWAQGGQFCGSRGMSLPILGLRVKLAEKAAAAWSLTYEASFIDGTRRKPVADGAACEADSLSPLEAFRVVLARRAVKPAQPPPAKPVRPPAKPARPPAKPARTTTRRR